MAGQLITELFSFTLKIIRTVRLSTPGRTTPPRAPPRHAPRPGRGHGGEKDNPTPRAARSIHHSKNTRRLRREIAVASRPRDFHRKSHAKIPLAAAPCHGARLASALLSARGRRASPAASQPRHQRRRVLAPCRAVAGHRAEERAARRARSGTGRAPGRQVEGGRVVLLLPPVVLHGE